MDAVVSVWDVASKLVECCSCGPLVDGSDPNAVHEANLLMLDITKAGERLDWHPLMDIDQCIALTADWYKRYRTEDVYNLCVEEIKKYVG
jgi:CDP-glucose 4,6-dehydratase